MSQSIERLLLRENLERGNRSAIMCDPLSQLRSSTRSSAGECVIIERGRKVAPNRQATFKVLQVHAYWIPKLAGICETSRDLLAAAWAHRRILLSAMTGWRKSRKSMLDAQAVMTQPPLYCWRLANGPADLPRSNCGEP